MIKAKAKTVNGYEDVQVYNWDEYHTTESTYTKKYYDRFLTFDIETSKVDLGSEHRDSFMYCWQIGIDDDVIFGNTWDELRTLLNRIYIDFGGAYKIVAYVHNLSYEWQFMKDFFEWKSVFAIDKHTVLKCSTDEIEFRCSYKLSNMSLEKFIESTPGHYYIKGSGDLDYSVLRTPNTQLTEIENGYRYCDVRPLHHAIEHLLEDDTLESIPLTSTGYVRRECREAMRGRKNRKEFKDSIVDIETYNLLLDCFRGGNTASNRYCTNMILDNVGSYDLASSYPYVLMAYEYPHGKFMNCTIEDIEELEYYNNKYCTIGRYTFINMRLKRTDEPIPYISHSKCQKVDKDALCYNGRVLESSYVETALTNIDFNIVNDMYDYDELYVNDFKFSRKKMLSPKLRKVIMKYFTDKTTLKGIDDMYYFYMKQKNKLNSIYGMMVSHILRECYEWKDDTLQLKEQDKQEQMDKYNESRNSFLCFQWGVFVTAYARMRLQKGINKIYEDVVYVDTDSIKYIGDHEKDFEELNEEVYRHVNDVDVPYYVNHNGELVYMGLWDKEKPYEKFKTLGAKKYAYVQKGKLGVTVSGLSKKNAPFELEEKGGLEAFKIGTVFLNSGRTTAYYHDSGVHTININGEEIKTGSYVTIEDTTYTLGMTDQMLSIINCLHC